MASPSPAISRMRRSARGSWSRACRGLGGLDIVVNNAARQQTRASILDVSSEDFDATMKTNIHAPSYGAAGGSGQP